MNIKIRNAEIKDLDDCYNVENRCYTDEGASKERIKKRIKLYPQGFLVAETKERIVGIINGTSTNKEDISEEELKDMVDFDINGKNIVIFSVAVLPEFQGQGIAKLLLNKFIDKCKTKEKILLICKEHHIKMYEKFGFKLIGKSESKHGGFDWFEMILKIKPN